MQRAKLFIKAAAATSAALLLAFGLLAGLWVADTKTRQTDGLMTPPLIAYEAEEREVVVSFLGNEAVLPVGAISDVAKEAARMEALAAPEQRLGIRAVGEAISAVWAWFCG